mmetsp:Transcript_29049/g.47005  ORF Transcript_29049/g.47005 Transcript_29049/m.47005 type:complete len:232 (-) Transcript_29049:112-807(-)
MLPHGLKPHLVNVGSTLATGKRNEALQAREMSQIQVGREHGDHEESSLRVFRSRTLKNWTLFCSKLMIPRWPGSSLRVQDAFATSNAVRPREVFCWGSTFCCSNMCTTPRFPSCDAVCIGKKSSGVRARQSGRQGELGTLSPSSSKWCFARNSSSFFTSFFSLAQRSNLPRVGSGDSERSEESVREPPWSRWSRGSCGSCGSMVPGRSGSRTRRSWWGDGGSAPTCGCGGR